MAKYTHWSREELMDSVIAYKKIMEDASVIKSMVYRELSDKYPIRTPGAFERRMQNISYVFILLGRTRAKGLTPAVNVGVNVIRQIEEILSEIENRPTDFYASEREEQNSAMDEQSNTAPSGNRNPERVIREVSDYQRDKKVVAWILNVSDGKCENCLKDAPFLTVKNIPFLEVHHMRRLCEGGTDTISNAVALCPNCHRELHFSINNEFVRDILYARLGRLIKEW